MDDYQTSKLKMAKELSEAILTDLEINQLPISPILMKTKRLARMLRDSDAQKWLDYEITGYPVVFDPAELGSCRKYYTGDRPVIRDERSNKHYPIGLPHLESYIASTKAEAVSRLGANESQKIHIINKHHELVNDFERLKNGIHNYVSEVNISLAMGDFTQDIFDETRLAADRFIRENCPRAGEQLLAIHDRMKFNDPESRLQVISAVQRVLAMVADVVVPVQEKVYIDKSGRERNIEKDQYLNRLVSLIEQNVKNDPLVAMMESELNFIFAKTEITPEKPKSLHPVVTVDDVHLAILHMYLIIAEIAKIKRINTIYLNLVTSKSP